MKAKRITPESIALEVRTWIGAQIRNIAVEHDLEGPHISLVRRLDYKKRLIAEIRTRCLAAIAAHQVEISMSDLDWLCKIAAEELMRIRLIRYAHQTDKLPTAALKLLPVYAVYQGYFEEEPLLCLNELVAAIREHWRSEIEGPES